MDKEHVASLNIKKINRNRVYRAIYEERTTSKFRLVNLLGMGLSTVSYNLTALSEEGLIKFDGFYESTGGRKAKRIRIDPVARISIGIGMLSDRLHYVASDLYGQMICRNTYPIRYAHTPDYYKRIGDCLTRFITENSLDPARILGVAIAIQGIVSRDGRSVSYGTLISNSGMTLDDIIPYIPFPCRMEHDSKAAGNLALWNHPDIRNGIIFLLNQNLGSAIITNRLVQWGDHMRSGLIEHTCMHPDGPLCYCGRHGCLETYCSAARLERESGMDAASFFTAMRETRALELRRIWQDFLNHLAIIIRNLSVTVDGTFFLSGYLAPYITKEDLHLLLDMVNAMAPWPLTEDQLQVGHSGQYTPALGAALHYVSEFIASI